MKVYLNLQTDTLILYYVACCKCHLLYFTQNIPLKLIKGEYLVRNN